MGAVAVRRSGDAIQELSPKQNMLWNSAGSIINLGCQWLISVLIVRLAGGRYEAAGIFSLATSVYGIFSPIGQYRMKTYQVSDVNDENSTGEYLAFRVLTCGIALVLCTGYALLTCSSDAWVAIVLYAAYKSVTLLIEVFHGCDQKRHRMDYIGQSLALQGVVSLGLFCSVFVASQSLELALASMALGMIAIFLLLDYPRTKRFGPIVVRISRKKAGRLLVVCFPVVVAGIAASAAPSLPRQSLSSIMGAASLGAYASIAAPIAIIQMGATYIYGPLLSYFSESYARGDKRAFLLLLAKVVLGIAAVGVICTIGILLLGEPVLVILYGESIRSFVYLMVPMVPFAVLTGLMWFANDMLISLRNFRGSFVGGVTSLLVAVATMHSLIIWFGMNGVTFCGLLSCGASLLVMGFFFVSQVRSHDWDAGSSEDQTS